MKKSKLIQFVIVTFCFVYSPTARAVNPPPDGGYPNFNTAEGTNVLKNLTTGAANTAVGWFSLFSDTTGSFNTATGAGALLFNTADENTAFGTAALLFNTTGDRNTAVGVATLLNNTVGSDNTATGESALQNNTAGSSNTANGFQALSNNTTGGTNTATGVNALLSNSTGGDNTANGVGALVNNSTGGGNTAIGGSALLSNTTGLSNTALGTSAGVSITGSGNVCIGEAVTGEAGVDNSTYIRNVNTLTQNFSAGVNDYVTVRLSDGRLGHTAVVSSQRYKQDIKPLATVSQALYALMPVSFRLKKEFDPTQALGFGLIAEEVEKVDPALVYRNDKGQVESVRYEMVNAMLLNEFLKEHRKGEEQDLAISQLKSTLAQQEKKFESKLAQQEQQIAALMATLQQLAAGIELNKAESRTIAEE